MSGTFSSSSAGTLKLQPREFLMIQKMVYDKFGIDLDKKEVLVSARLSKKMREMDFASFEDYYNFVQKDASGQALTEMVDVLTTNHTSFFREPQHFDFLSRVIIPNFDKVGMNRIWSAACSTGEEPYSIAFTLTEALGAKAASAAQILATDISTRVLSHASKGLYEQDRFAQVPVDRLRKHVLKGTGSSDGFYLVKKENRQLIEFQRLNLMEDFSQKVGKFAAIFCRNVMIYFDQPTMEHLVNRLAAQLEVGGHLLIGHSESLNNIKHPLKYIAPATFQKVENSEPSARARR
jgi:chemotaxis protein methyltransferase CheR